jgi:hypothetical protein
VYLFLVAAAALAGIGAGLAPARFGARGNVLAGLQSVGPRFGGLKRPGSVRAALIATQAAASLVLISLAAVTARGAIHAARIDVGFDATRLMAVSFSSGRTDAERRSSLDSALARVRDVRGVRAASLTDMVPFVATPLAVDFVREGRRQRAFLAHTDAD